MEIKKLLDKMHLKTPRSKSSFLVILGIIGLLLLLVSSFTEKPKNEQVVQEVLESNVTTTSLYLEELEGRLETILSDMLSNTEVSVMITLNSGIEYIYADELKTGAEIKNDHASYKTEQSDSNQKTYVIVKDSEGNENALLITEKMPTVRGVVVVCDGGQTEKVSYAVKTAVKSVLDIAEEKICVIGRS